MKKTKKKNKIDTRKKIFKSLKDKEDKKDKDSEDDNFVNDVNNARDDVSSFVDNYIEKLVDKHMHDSLDSILEDF